MTSYENVNVYIYNIYELMHTPGHWIILRLCGRYLSGIVERNTEFIVLIISFIKSYMIL